MSRKHTNTEVFKLYIYIYIYIFIFTHLADAFIQSNLQCNQAIHFFVSNDTIFSEPILYRKFWGSADTDPIRYQFSVFFNVYFLYFSVLTWSSLFCVLNTIYNNVYQLVGQKFRVCSPKVGRKTVLSGSRIVYSQINDINKKHNSKCFSDARLLF